MKKEIRLIGIDDSPFDKFRSKSKNNNKQKNKPKQKDILIIGTVFRGGDYLEGVLSSKIRVDGINSTKKLIEMINNCKFKPSLKGIILDGIAFGGFNIIDINKLNKKTNIPVIVVIRKYPNFKKIKQALNKMNQPSRFELIKKAGKIYKVDNIYIKLAGIDLNNAKDIPKISCKKSFLPKPLRVAHMIASGIIKGESKGRV